MESCQNDKTFFNLDKKNHLLTDSLVNNSNIIGETNNFKFGRGNGVEVDVLSPEVATRVDSIEVAENELVGAPNFSTGQKLRSMYKDPLSVFKTCGKEDVSFEMKNKKQSMSESKQSHWHAGNTKSSFNEKAFANMINLSQGPSTQKRVKTEGNSAFLSPNQDNLLINQNSIMKSPIEANSQSPKKITRQESSFTARSGAFGNSSFGKKPTRQAGGNLISNVNSASVIDCGGQLDSTADKTIDSDCSLIKNPNSNETKASILFNQKTASAYTPMKDVDFSQGQSTLIRNRNMPMDVLGDMGSVRKQLFSDTTESAENVTYHMNFGVSSQEKNQFSPHDGMYASPNPRARHNLRYFFCSLIDKISPEKDMSKMTPSRFKNTPTGTPGRHYNPRSFATPTKTPKATFL